MILSSNPYPRTTRINAHAQEWFADFVAVTSGLCVHSFANNVQRGLVRN